MDETSEWRVSDAWLTGEGCVTVRHYNYYVSGQVQQNGHVYNEISYTGMAWVDNGPSFNCIESPAPISGIRGLLRSENGIIYQPGTNGEDVLYDFTMEVGDSAQGFGVSYKVDSIDQILVNDHLCKRLWVSEYYQGLSGQPIWIVESVGHQHGLFEVMYQFENWSDLCYREHGASVISYEFSSACEITSVEERKPREVSISPNPSTGIFNTNLPQETAYSIHDLFGRIVLDGHVRGSSQIDLSSQPNGIYLISFESEKGISTAKLVKQ